jgi:threonine dehydratase
VPAAELEVMVEARDQQHAQDITTALEETYTVRRL